MNPKLLFLLVAVVLVPVSHADEADLTSYADASYALLDPDWGWGPFEDENGFTVNAEVQVAPNFSVNAWYNNSSDVSVNGGETHQPPFLWYSLSAWYSVGGKWHHRLGADTSAFLALSWDQMDTESMRTQESEDFSGLGYHVGLKYRFGQSFSASVQVGRVDLIIDDTQLIAELSYSLSDQLALNTRIRDLDQMDLTAYELGLRWHY